jgi:DNA polymerase III alpha subunit (gram-positive type)
MGKTANPFSMATPVVNQLFMLDIETTGVDPKTEEVLQVAVMEMEFKAGFWEKGRTLNLILHSDRQPTTKFARDHMVELYGKSNLAPKRPAEEVRQEILGFFKNCGAQPPNVFLAGWNAGIFDVPFLAHHNLLFPARYENDQLQGDVHYRIYELSGAIQLVANMRGHNELNAVLREAQKKSPRLEGNRHDALFDCERQLHILNALIEMAKSTRS